MATRDEYRDQRRKDPDWIAAKNKTDQRIHERVKALGEEATEDEIRHITLEEANYAVAEYYALKEQQKNTHNE